MKNTSNLIFKHLYLRLTIILFCCVFFGVSTFKAMTFSLCCHFAGILFYRAEYHDWLFSMKTYFEQENANLLESNYSFYYVKMIFVYFCNIFMFGLYEIFAFTQIKALAEESPEEPKI